MSDDRARYSPWLGYALEQGLEHGVVEAADLIVHATPEVLASQLPHDVMSQLLSRALQSGTLTAVSVLETAPPALLAEHVDPQVLWGVLSDGAARAQVSVKGASSSDEGKAWLAAILQKGLDLSVLSPADVLRFLPPSEFVRDLPLPVMAELIRSGLTRGNFDPALVLVHLTPKVIAEHLQSALAWSAIADAAARRFGVRNGTQPAAVSDTGPIRLPPVETSAPAPVLSSSPAPVLSSAPAPAPSSSAAAPAKQVERKVAAAAPKAKEPLATAKIEPVVARKAAAAQKSDDWTSPDDLEVLEEQPLPPPPVAPSMARK